MKANKIMSSNETAGDSCGTPVDIVEAVRSAVGGIITLDPCSNTKAQEIVQSDYFYTKDDDCLAQDWSEHYNGTLYCNPPYSAKAMRSICPRLVDEAPRFIGGAVILVNAVHDTAYGSALVESADAVIFPKRINFTGTGGSNPHRQMFLVWGLDVAHRLIEELGAKFRSVTWHKEAVRRWSIRMARVAHSNEELWWRVHDSLLEHTNDPMAADDFDVFCQMAEDGELA